MTNMNSSPQCRTGKSHGQNRSFIGRTNTSQIQVSLILVSLLGLLAGEKLYVLAAEQDALADPNSSFNKCYDAYSEIWSSDENLGYAVKEHEAKLDNALTDTEWTIGYSDEAKYSLKSACDEYNDVFWMDLDTTLELVCDWPEKDITGRTVEFYGIGSCLANTSDCREWDSMDLVTPMWANAEGIDCRAPDTASAEKDEVVDSENGDSDGEASENLAPGNQVDPDERLPFLTDDDVKCMDGTADFLLGDKGLASAQDTFKSSQFLNEEDSSVKVMGYPEEAAKAMKSACELNFGTWAFVKSSKLTCVIKGMETIAMHVHNFGKCLVTIDECVAMDPKSLLRVDLAALGFNCWEDEEAGDDESAAGSSENASTSTEDSETGTDTEESGDANGSDGETTAAEAENNNEEDNKDTDEDNGPDSSDGNDDFMSEFFDDLGMSESDQQCMGDSAVMESAHPELEAAEAEYANSIELENSSVTEMMIGFSGENANKLKSVCNDDAIGGYFSFIEEQEFVCTMMSAELNLKITNMASCLANTDECRSMNPLLMLEDLWQTMGLTCEEKTGGDDEATNSSTTDTTQPDNSDKGDNKEEPNGDDSLFKELGLSESEVACMTESSSFIEDSVVLTNATKVYQQSFQMDDPAKLGFTSASALEMERVCEEQGGIWSFIESDDFTCTITQGRERCINVYNFGSCIASNSDCQSMDSFVLVKGFFLEVLGSTCRAKCDKQANNAGDSPSPAPHKDSNNNLSAQNNTASNSGGGSKLPSLTTAAVVLGVVAAISLVGFFRYRASRGIERDHRSQYEMTEISDLGFQVFT